MVLHRCLPSSSGWISELVPLLTPELQLQPELKGSDLMSDEVSFDEMR